MSRKNTANAERTYEIPQQNKISKPNNNGNKRNAFESRIPVAKETIINGIKDNNKLINEVNTLENGYKYFGTYVLFNSAALSIIDVRPKLTDSEKKLKITIPLNK